MTTTTSTTSTATPTPTPTPAQTSQSVVANAAQSLLTSLDAGSGIDTATLVPALVQAQFATKTAALSAKNDALTAQISAVSDLKSTMTTMSSVMTSLATGGTLQTQPTSSVTGVLNASALPGASVGALSSKITVNALATAQGARTTTAIADRTATIGSGTFTLTLGTATYSADGTQMTGFTAGSSPAVSITVTNASLDGVAAAINGANAGVSAAVVTDADGKAYLSLKGATGAAQAFTLAASSDPSGKLAQFNVGTGAPTALTGTAANASLTVDGITVQRSTNSISDLVSGVKLDLAGTGTTTLGIQRPTAALTDAVNNFVSYYNEIYGQLQTDLDPVDGKLKGDPAARTMLTALQQLTTRSLVPNAGSGVPATLAQIGLATNRDGTLTVNSSVLQQAMSNYPDAIAAIFAPTTANAIGLSSTIQQMSFAAASTTTGLGASTNTYTNAQKDLADQQADLSRQSDAMTQRLTQQFASMNARVSAYKATQTFMDNQIKAWNKSN